MRKTSWNPRLVVTFGGALALTGCKDTTDPAPAQDTGVATETNDDENDSSGSTVDDSGSTGEDDPNRAEVVHSFGEYVLSPHEEIQPCIQWTLNNERPIYIQAVTLANQGGYHHSNWFVVPDDLYEGEDGFFDCSDRGFTELDAAIQGTVLTAQSTQSRYERMELPPGVVIKAPPRHKIIAGGHLLNLANGDYATELRMGLDIIHPSEVDVVAAPFRLTYFDLQIPGFTEARFTASCNLADAYETAAARPIDLKLYYVLPHYHYLGNFFDLTISGGPQDGESVFRLDGFNADASGRPYPEPIDLTGAEGFTFTCGFNNWTDQQVGWGIGDQEMCVMLGLADSRVIMDGSAYNNEIVGTDGEILLNESSCDVLGLQKNAAQTLPEDDELTAPLYIPPSDPGDDGLPPVDECKDTPADAAPAGEATLTRLRETLFVSTCQFSSCHSGANASAGLDLAADNLHTTLLEHEVTGATSLPLIAPGDPEGSWLYQRVAYCNPTDDAGNPVSHMPLNSPELSNPELVATLRDWIQAGAQDN